jgi:hypothetical protein
VKCIAISVFFILYAVVFSGTGSVFAGTDAAAFLNNGVGARALAMGEAFVSVCDDSTAIYWNPAGLGKLNRFSVSAMGQSLGSTNWDTLQNITPQYQFLGLTFPVNSNIVPGVDSNTFGIALITNNLNNVPYTYLDAQGSIVRNSFNDSENAYFFSWGLPLFDLGGGNSICAGVSLKYITEQFTQIAEASASGYDIDFGLLYPIGNINIGLLLERGAEMKWANGADDIAGLMTKLGVSDKFWLGRSVSALGSFDLAQRQDQPLMAYLGAELGYERKFGGGALGFDGVFLRLGIDGYAVENRNDSASAINSNLNLTAGIGLNIICFGYKMQMDYAMGSYALGDQNRMSLSLYF